MQSLLTRAIGVAIGDHGRSDIRTAGGVGAVTDPIAKVDVLAEAGSFGGRAPEGWSQGEHVVEAGLLGVLASCARAREG